MTQQSMIITAIDRAFIKMQFGMNYWKSLHYGSKILK